MAVFIYPRRAAVVYPSPDIIGRFHMARIGLNRPFSSLYYQTTLIFSDYLLVVQTYASSIKPQRPGNRTATPVEWWGCALRRTMTYWKGVLYDAESGAALL